MHVIQNSWFTHNWILLLLFACGVVSVVGYINNRKKLYKIAVTSFFTTLLAVVCFLLLPSIQHSLSLNKEMLPDLNVGESSEEKISTFSRVIDFLLGIIKHKLGD